MCHICFPQAKTMRLLSYKMQTVDKKKPVAIATIVFFEKSKFPILNAASDVLVMGTNFGFFRDFFLCKLTVDALFPVYRELYIHFLQIQNVALPELTHLL